MENKVAAREITSCSKIKYYFCGIVSGVNRRHLKKLAIAMIFDTSTTSKVFDRQKET